MQLGDVQARTTAALMCGDAGGCAGVVAGGGDPVSRLAIHIRHYQTSLIRSIVERFPATVWLAGAPLVSEAAAAFVRGQPPARPCLAEYGEEFPAFLGTWPGAAHLPYLGQFAAIDWNLGRLAIAVAEPPITLRLDWSLDELMTFFLSDRAPEAYELRAETVWLELRGARGELSLQRRTDEA